MPMVSHTEQNFTASDSVRDMVIGMSDGLTVPFALAAGLTGAISATGIIVTAGLEEIEPRRARNSALTISSAYIVGGMIPLLPYMLFENSGRALMLSVILTLLALFGFGFAKGLFTGAPPMRSALQTSCIGGLAAAAAFAIARIIS